MLVLETALFPPLVRSLSTAETGATQEVVVLSQRSPAVGIVGAMHRERDARGRGVRGAARAQCFWGELQVPTMSHPAFPTLRQKAQPSAAPRSYLHTHTHPHTTKRSVFGGAPAMKHSCIRSPSVPHCNCTPTQKVTVTDPLLRTISLTAKYCLT